MKFPYNDILFIHQEVVKENDDSFTSKGDLLLLKVMYTNGNTYIIKVKDDLYYYGDGEKVNAFGQNAVQFLRFNPYLEDVSTKKVEIPESITKEIEKNAGIN